MEISEFLQIFNENPVKLYGKYGIYDITINSSGISMMATLRNGKELPEEIRKTLKYEFANHWLRGEYCIDEQDTQDGTMHKTKLFTILLT